MIGEQLILAELKSIGFEKIKHCGKESYQKGHNETRRGVDFKIYGEHGKLTTAIENKNWKTLKRQYSRDIAQTEVIDRFDGVDAEFKVLTIPDANVFDKQALALIRSHGIHIFETNKLLGGKDFRSRFFYVLKSRLDRFFEDLETQLEQQHIKEQSLIDQWLKTQQTNNHQEFNQQPRFVFNVLDVVNSSSDNNTTDTILNNLTEHTIHLIDKILETNELATTERQELVYRQRKEMLKGTLWNVD